MTPHFLLYLLCCLCSALLLLSSIPFDYSPSYFREGIAGIGLLIIPLVDLDQQVVLKGSVHHLCSNPVKSISCLETVVALLKLG